MIRHIVIFWTDKPHGENQQKVLNAAKELKNIPGVINFHCGSPVSSARAAVDDSFACAIAMDFEDAEALKTYASHPEHVRFVNEVLKPLVGRFVVYDF